MNQTRCIVILSILALFVASVSVAGNISLPDASQKVFEGKPCINSPRAIGNYPASPFLFYIPTTGQRPMEWSAEKLPKGLKLDSKTGIITGSVASKGEYTVTLKAKNALGTSTEKLVIRIAAGAVFPESVVWAGTVAGATDKPFAYPGGQFLHYHTHRDRVADASPFYGGGHLVGGFAVYFHQCGVCDGTDFGRRGIHFHDNGFCNHHSADSDWRSGGDDADKFLRDVLHGEYLFV